MSDDRGTTIIIVTLAMFVIMGFVGFAVDLGMAWNNRRQNQAAADTGVMAAALEAANGETAVVAAAKNYVRRNIDASVPDIDWDAAWASCTDGSKPPGYIAATSTDCISFHGAGFIRVRVPNQIHQTYFARLVGIDTLTTSAFAVAKLGPDDAGGVLPFGVLAASSSGQELCLRSGTGGQAVDPCDGPDSGNFGSLDSPRYGTGAGCDMTDPKGTLFAHNLALGGDHLIVEHPDGDPDTVPFLTDGPPNGSDACTHFAPNRMWTFTGVGSGLAEGMITGDDFDGMPARLRQGNNPKRLVGTKSQTWKLDNKPIWAYFLPNSIDIDDGQFVGDCNTADFTGVDHDADIERVEACLAAWTPAHGELFSYTIYQSPRFAVVPYFYEDSWPTGTSDLRTIAAFRMIFFHRAMLKCDANGCTDFVPGDVDNSPVTVTGNNLALDQLTAFLLPVTPLVAEATEHGVNGSLGPFRPELYR